MNKNCKETAQAVGREMTGKQEEQIQGGLKSALKENAYGVTASKSENLQENGGLSPWVITF